MSDTTSGHWTAGAARVLAAWLTIAVIVWISWLVVSPGDTRSRAFILLMFVVMSAALAPIYGGVTYLALKRRERRAGAKAAPWTYVVLFVLGFAAAAWAYLLLLAVGRAVH